MVKFSKEVLIIYLQGPGLYYYIVYTVLMNYDLLIFQNFIFTKFYLTFLLIYFPKLLLVIVNFCNLLLVQSTSKKIFRDKADL